MEYLIYDICILVTLSSYVQWREIRFPRKNNLAGSESVLIGNITDHILYASEDSF